MSTGEAVTPIHGSYWIIPGRFRAGVYPGSVNENETREKLRWLLEQNINMIFDLTEAGEAGLQPYLQIFHEEAAKARRTVTHRRMPIKDFSTPPKERVVEILDAIDLSLSEGKSIYLHCYGGKGRTGIVVGCYLVRHGTPGQDALTKIIELRKNIPWSDGESPETEGQKRMVLEWRKSQ